MGSSPLNIKDMLTIWRLIVGLVVVQEIGGVAGLLTIDYYAALDKFWLGGGYYYDLFTEPLHSLLVMCTHSMLLAGCQPLFEPWGLVHSCTAT